MNFSFLFSHHFFSVNSCKHMFLSLEEQTTIEMIFVIF